jgi:hypothetical protein
LEEGAATAAVEAVVVVQVWAGLAMEAEEAAAWAAAEAAARAAAATAGVAAAVEAAAALDRIRRAQGTWPSRSVRTRPCRR